MNMRYPELISSSHNFLFKANIGSLFLCVFGRFWYIHYLFPHLLSY